MNRAREERTVIPSFNVPYHPMLDPLVKALRDTRSFGFIAVARPEWIKFQAGSPKAIYELYQQYKDERFTRLHLDHVPVIDEDGQRVDYEEIILGALDMGFDSVMVDGSRLSLKENIEATRRIVEAARQRAVPVEAELGAVLGHEEGPIPPYEELFSSGRGFTDPADAEEFVRETGVHWLSVAIGNIHGAVSLAERDKKKVEARLDIDHLEEIDRRVKRPLVLHGGSGIQREYLYRAFESGISKINIGTTVRQAYEEGLKSSVNSGRDMVYRKAVWLLSEELKVAGSQEIVNPD
jgi:ketose-bisphosphate aldolase